MKIRSTILTTTVILGFATLAACGGGGGSDPETPEFEAYKYRDSVMHAASTKMALINGMAREQIPLDEAKFVKATADLKALAGMMLEGFENKTLVPESMTEPAVWENWDDFQSRMNNLVTAADALAMAAANGGFQAARGLVTASPGGTSSNCGGCHTTYRKRDDD
jgi:cytochrome c556